MFNSSSIHHFCQGKAFFFFDFSLASGFCQLGKNPFEFWLFGFFYYFFSIFLLHNSPMPMCLMQRRSWSRPVSVIGIPVFLQWLILVVVFNVYEELIAYWYRKESFFGYAEIIAPIRVISVCIPGGWRCLSDTRIPKVIFMFYENILQINSCGACLVSVSLFLSLCCLHGSDEIWY